MTKQGRIEYLVCTLCVWVSGFVIYGLLGSIQPIFNGSGWISFLVIGLGGGLFLGSIASAIILAAVFFRKQGISLKIIAALLWPLTMAVCMYVGIFTYLPYQIYNVIKILSMIRTERRNPEAEAIPEVETVPIDTQSNN